MNRTRPRITWKSRWPLCKRCRVEFEPGRLNARGHCPYCADELMENHSEF